MEDWLLILQCKRGQTRALERLYHKYKKVCLILAVSMVNDTAAAEDIWHDVFLRFAQTVKGFRLTGSLKAYLMTCVANQARNYSKSQQRHIQIQPVEQISDGEILDGLVFNEQALSLALALETLPMEQREVVLLYAQGGMTFEQIANQFGVSRDTVKSRYRYGLQKLKVFFEKEHHGF